MAYVRLSGVCTGSPRTVKVGETVSWTTNVTASGASGGVSYEWSGDASGSSSHVNETYNTPGTKTATVRISYGGEEIVKNCSVTVRDNPDLSVYCIANPGTVYEDETVNFTAYATGGTGSYSYSWSGAVSGNSRTVSDEFDTPRTETAHVTVTSGGKTASANCSVNVREKVNSLSGTCTVSPYSVEKGETVTWRASASGGNGSYEYSWSGDVSGDGREVSKSFNSTGTKRGTVTITSGGKSITRTCSVVIENDNNDNDSDLNGYCYGTPENPDKGEKVKWYAVAHGGDGDYEYRWSGDVSGTSRTETEEYNSTGTKRAKVRIESDGDTIYEECEVRVRGNNNNDDSNISVYSYTSSNPGTPSGVLASGVFLSDLPYTGVSDSAKTALFVFGLFLWSAGVAYILLRKKGKGAVLSKALAFKKSQAGI